MAQSINMKYLVISIISLIILSEPAQSIDPTSNSSTKLSDTTDIVPRINSVSNNGHQQEQHKDETNSISSSDDFANEHKRRVIDSSLYSGKRLLLTDRLYKLNVYLDPICEQIDTLTSKQLTRVALQFRQFINHTNGRLGKCVESQYKHDPSEYPITRDQLREICNSKETERYKLFEICAIKNWNVLIDLELDRIIDNRIKCGLRKQQQLTGQQNGTGKDTNTLKQLHDDEKLLIDDIVNHMHRHNRNELYSLLVNDISRENSSIITNSNGSGENVTIPNIEISIKDKKSQSNTTNLFNDSTMILGDKNETVPERQNEKEPYIELKNITLPMSTSETRISGQENSTKIEAASSRLSNTTDQQNTEKLVTSLEENLLENHSSNSTTTKPKIQESEEAATRTASITPTKSPLYDVHNDSLTSSAHLTRVPLTAESLPKSNVEAVSTVKPLALSSTNDTPPVSPAPSHLSSASNPSPTSLSAYSPVASHASLVTLAPSTPPMDLVTTSSAPLNPLVDTVLVDTPTPMARQALTSPSPSISTEGTAQPAQPDIIHQIPLESASNRSTISTINPVEEVESLLNGTTELLNKLEDVTLSVENKTKDVIETIATTKSPETVGIITIIKPSTMTIANASGEPEIKPAISELHDVILPSNSFNQTMIPSNETATDKPTDAGSPPTSSNVLIELEGLPTKPVNDYLKLIEKKQIEHTTKVGNSTQSDHHSIGPKLTVDPATHQSKAHLEIPLSHETQLESGIQASNQTATNVIASHIQQQQQNSSSSNYHHQTHNKKIIMKVKIDPDKLAKGELPINEVIRSLLNHGVDARTVESIIENITPTKSIFPLANGYSIEAKTNLTFTDSEPHKLLPNESMKLNLSETSSPDLAQHKQIPSEKRLLLRADKIGPSSNKNSSQPQDPRNIHQAATINIHPFISVQPDRSFVSDPKHITEANKTIKHLMAPSQIVHTIQNSKAPLEVVNPIIHSVKKLQHLPVAQTQPTSSHSIQYAKHPISNKIPVQQRTIVAQNAGKSVAKVPVKTIKKLTLDPKSAPKVTISHQTPKRGEIISRAQSKQSHFVQPHIQPLHPLSPFANHQSFPLNGLHYQNDPNNFQMMSHDPANSMNFPPFNEYGAAFDPNMHAFSGLPHQPQMNFMMPPNFIAGPQHETILKSNEQMVNNLHRTDGDLHNMEHARQMFIDPIGHSEKHRISEIAKAQQNSRGASQILDG